MIARYYKQIKKDNHDRVSEIKGTVKEAKKELEDNDLKKVSLTDHEARFMKNKKGRFELSYNPQITTDHKAGIIVANDVCKDCTDHKQLEPQIEQVEENCGKLNDETKVSADNGYYNGENLDYLKKKKLDGYIPDAERAQKAKGKEILIGEFDKSNFKYDEKTDQFICPKENILKFATEYYSTEKKKKIREYIGVKCKSCPYNSKCTKRKDKIKRLKIPPFEKERIEMKEKMQTKEAKEIYKKRKQVVEPVIGHYKENLGFRDFLTTSLDTVKNEFNLVCAASNLKRIWIIIQDEKKKMNRTMQVLKAIGLQKIFPQNITAHD